MAIKAITFPGRLWCSVNLTFILVENCEKKSHKVLKRSLFLESGWENCWIKNIQTLNLSNILRQKKCPLDVVTVSILFFNLTTI